MNTIIHGRKIIDHDNYEKSDKNEITLLRVIPATTLLTCIWKYILTFCLTWYLTFIQSSILICSDSLSSILSAMLSAIYSDNIYSDILSDIYSDILSGILSDIYSGILSGLLSCHWGQAVPTAIRTSPVEARQCPLRSWQGGGDKGLGSGKGEGEATSDKI